MAGNIKRCYHFFSAYWAINDLRKRHVKISLFDKVNDERELQAYFVVGTGLTNQAFTQWFAGRFTMLGFGIDLDDEHLWTEYGDVHRGLCFGFDIGTHIVKAVKYVAKKREVELPRATKPNTIRQLKKHGKSIMRSLRRPHYGIPQVLCAGRHPADHVLCWRTDSTNTEGD
jgi:hypothetical protein